MRKQRMWNKRTWPSHVFTSFARSSINTFVSEALDLEKKKQNTKHSLGRRNSWNDTQTANPQCTRGNKKKRGKKKSFLHRGGINNLLELFHTLPLSLGVAELCKDAPEGTLSILLLWHWPLHTEHCDPGTLPTQLHQTLAGSRSVPAPSPRGVQEGTGTSLGICLAHLHSLHVRGVTGHGCRGFHPALAHIPFA